MKKQNKKLHRIFEYIHRYRVISGLIAVFAVIIMFGNALADQSLSYTDTSALTLNNVDIPFLLRDMQFEATQSKRDIQRIDDEFRKTLSQVKNTNFTCSALTDLLTERNAFDSLIKKSENLSTSSTKQNILQAYTYYSMIRGTQEIPGIREKTYGGNKDPTTGKIMAGTLKELETCRKIATTITKSCDIYNSTQNDKKHLPKKMANLYDDVLKDLEPKCLQPNSLLNKAKLTLNDLVTNQAIDNIFGSTEIVKRLKRIQKKAQLESVLSAKRSFFTMVESLLE